MIFANACAARYLCLRRQVKVHLALPAMVVRLRLSLFSGEPVVGRADSNPLGSTCKILCFSAGVALPELACSRYGKGRQGGQSWKADAREASEG